MSAMNPEMPKSPSPEELAEQARKAQEASDLEYLAIQFRDHPETRESEIAAENRREAGPEVAKFERMVADFKEKFPLAELRAIIELRPEAAPFHPLRAPANKALTPIRALRIIIEKETNISRGECERLIMEWKELSDAVGIIDRNNKVDHDRPVDPYGWGV